MCLEFEVAFATTVAAKFESMTSICNEHNERSVASACPLHGSHTAQTTCVSIANLRRKTLDCAHQQIGGNIEKLEQPETRESPHKLTEPKNTSQPKRSVSCLQSPTGPHWPGPRPWLPGPGQLCSRRASGDEGGPSSEFQKTAPAAGCSGSAGSASSKRCRYSLTVFNTRKNALPLNLLRNPVPPPVPYSNCCATMKSGSANIRRSGLGAPAWRCSLKGLRLPLGPGPGRKGYRCKPLLCGALLDREALSTFGPEYKALTEPLR